MPVATPNLPVLASYAARSPETLSIYNPAKLWDHVPTLHQWLGKVTLTGILSARSRGGAGGGSHDPKAAHLPPAPPPPPPEGSGTKVLCTGRNHFITSSSGWGRVGPLPRTRVWDGKGQAPTPKWASSTPPKVLWGQVCPREGSLSLLVSVALGVLRKGGG